MAFNAAFYEWGPGNGGGNYPHKSCGRARRFAAVGLNTLEEIVCFACGAEGEESVC
jgi:hypothetical protein